jgi:hypothetical protein
MSTTKQNEANLANAQLSTGPRTAEGKARSSLNAVKHGLTAAHLLIPTESADDFEAHAASLRAHFAPADPLRSLLVDQLIAAAWRLRRARLFERLILEERADDIEEFQKVQGETYHDPADYFALAYRGDCSGEKALDSLSRHEARVERAFYRALKALGDPPRIPQNEPNSPVPETPGSVGPCPQNGDPLVTPSSVSPVATDSSEAPVGPRHVGNHELPRSPGLLHHRLRHTASSIASARGISSRHRETIEKPPVCTFPTDSSVPRSGLPSTPSACPPLEFSRAARSVTRIHRAFRCSASWARLSLRRR